MDTDGLQFGRKLRMIVEIFSGFCLRWRLLPHQKYEGDVARKLFLDLCNFLGSICLQFLTLSWTYDCKVC